MQITFCMFVYFISHSLLKICIGIGTLFGIIENSVAGCATALVLLIGISAILNVLEGTLLMTWAVAESNSR